MQGGGWVDSTARGFRGPVKLLCRLSNSRLGKGPADHKLQSIFHTSSLLLLPALQPESSIQHTSRSTYYAPNTVWVLEILLWTKQEPLPSWSQYSRRRHRTSPTHLVPPVLGLEERNTEQEWLQGTGSQRWGSGRGFLKQWCLRENVKMRWSGKGTPSHEGSHRGGLLVFPSNMYTDSEGAGLTHFQFLG